MVSPRSHMYVLILTAPQAGTSLRSLADVTGLNASTINRRHDTARRRIKENETIHDLLEGAVDLHHQRQ